MFPSKLLDLQMSPQPQYKRDEYLKIAYWSLPVGSSNSNQEFSVKPFSSQAREQVQSLTDLMKMRRELVDAADIDGDTLMSECNRILADASATSETPSHRLEDIFQTIGQILFIKHPLAISKEPINTHMKRFTGRLKFFDEAKNYGFIVMDLDGSDIFVYADDLSKTGLPREFLRTAKHGNLIRQRYPNYGRFQFTCMNYVGKYNQSRKAIDLTYLKLAHPAMTAAVTGIPCPF